MINISRIEIHRTIGKTWVAKHYSLEDFTREESIYVDEYYADLRNNKYGTISDFIDKDGNMYRIHFWVNFGTRVMHADISCDGELIEEIETYLNFKPKIYDEDVFSIVKFVIFRVLDNSTIELEDGKYLADVEEECITLLVKFMRNSYFLFYF